MAAIHFPTEYFSALGSLFGAAAGILAVIWFSASLYYQSQQIKEQRQQFLENFEQLREDNRRNSLVVVKDILSRAEERALKSNPNLKSINDLITEYFKIHDWPAILKSTDPDTVLEQGKNWIVMKETPAFLLMQGIKSAAETYFRSIGRSDIDFTIVPEQFVFEYGPTLWNVPYFEEYQCIAPLISESMVTMKQGRKTIQLAYSVAVYKKSLDEDLRGIIKEDKIFEAIKQHIDAGYKLPAIAEELLNNLE